MKPSTLRATILAEHQWIRTKLREAQESALAVLSGEIGRSGELRARVRELVGILRAHLDTEDELVLPVLKSGDAWGPVRAERMANEHAEQRAELSVLWRVALSGGAAELAYALLPFGRALREDMADEEELSLDQELFRDDLVVADQLDA